MSQLRQNIATPAQSTNSTLTGVSGLHTDSHYGVFPALLGRIETTSRQTSEQPTSISLGCIHHSLFAVVQPQFV